MTHREILLAAVDYIERHGHAKCEYGGRIDIASYDETLDDAPACAIGACATVARKDVTNLDIWTLSDVLEKQVAAQFAGIFSWNDASTPEEVVTMLRATAEGLQ